MPANFTRRRDLFLDAGITDPDRALGQLLEASKRLELQLEPGGDLARQLRPQMTPSLGVLPAEMERLARRVPQWLFERGGDLATALWLAHAERPDLDFAAFLFTVLDELLAQGREREAFGLLRFLVDVSFDFSRLYGEQKLSYGFLQEREPNPLVWRLLEYLEPRAGTLKVLDLGCGIGNDAVGLMASPKCRGYVGVDLSAEALERFKARETQHPELRGARLVQADFLSVLERQPEELQGVNLVYSYSSLHYFNSAEVKRIFDLARTVILPSGGFFAFGIKGAGSVWEGQGIPLYRPDVWVNFDGQSRWFPDKRALASELQRHDYEIRFHELHEHWSYSERGKRDLFHYLLCSARG